MPQSTGVTGSRLLLRRLRDVMAGGGTAQERLNKVVALIAANMVAEVCSVYIMRAGQVLELFATLGLKPEAVHRTRLRVGEGLVGDIAAHARPLALADAPSHPNFAYRPETGEEIYNSLMGVPILRSGRVLGVLVVQNRTRRHYNEEEIETLETTAMVLAELVASGELVGPDETRPTDGIAVLPIRLQGVMLNAGIAIGQAVLHEPRIELRRMVAEDPEAELERLRIAVASMHDALDRMLASADVARGGEHRDVLETYRMFAEDRGWLARIAEAVKSGLTAEAAVQKVKNDTRARMAQVAEPYLRERLLDLDDLANRLIRHLAGDGFAGHADRLPEDVILVARNMGPADLLDYDRRKLRGLVLEEGTATAHVAVVAGALDIPVLGRVSGLLGRIEEGDLLILDADNGQLLVRPDEDVQHAFAESQRIRSAREATFAASRHLPTITRDGVQIALYMNAGLAMDLPHLQASGAAGIGLYRTEVPFMIRSSFPSVAEQTEIYRRILEQAGDKPVVFRTLDVGGDKVLPYWSAEPEENPAMGWRAVRIGLDRPAILRQQLRALICAAAGRSLHVMFPMISHLGELTAARHLLQLELDRAERQRAQLPTRIEVGVMLEVPALIWQLPVLAGRVDFVSIGSNDLRQFLFATDRGSPRIGERYDVLSPPMLAMLRQVVRQCRSAGLPVSLCGEMAGRPLEAMALIGLGMRSLSMAPRGIGPVGSMIRSVDVQSLGAYLDRLLDSTEASLRRYLQAFARDHGVPI